MIMGKVGPKVGLILFPLLLFPLLSAKNGELPREMTTESGQKMIQVPAGSFIMGDKKGQVDEKPEHKVRLSSFYIDKYPVTQEEYEKVMGENPSRWKRNNNPVERVSWAGTAKYCNARSRLEGLRLCYNTETWECDFDANGYRLPTEEIGRAVV